MIDRTTLRPLARARMWIAMAIAGLAVALPQAAEAAPRKDFPVSSVLGLDAPLAVGDYVWDDDGVSSRGRIKIVVDLDSELIHVYRNGNEIGRSWIIYGFDGKPTPTGTFDILQKDIDHVSNIYKGAPMPYMLRLTWGGISIHGSEIEPDLATHGCIGLPDEFAAILFANAQLGDKVLVTRGWDGNDAAIQMAGLETGYDEAPAAQPTPTLSYSYPLDTPADQAAMTGTY